MPQHSHDQHGDEQLVGVQEQLVRVAADLALGQQAQSNERQEESDHSKGYGEVIVYFVISVK